MPASARYGSLPFKEAISFFENKLNIPTDRWADIWRDGHNSGFMVAGALKNDLLNDFRKAVDSAISEGKSIGWFKKEFKTIVAKHGWSHTGEANWRAKVIYDTNMRQSYNAGRYEQLQHFDFWEYQHGDSLHPRPMHLSWHGTVLPKEHGFWQTHFPQNGWGCKCKVRGRTAKQLERQGKKVKLPPKGEMTEWTDKATGEVHKIPKGIDPGFDYAPKKTAIKQQQKKLSVDKSTPFEPPTRIAPSAFSTVKGVDIHSLNEVLTQLADTSAKPQIEGLRQFLTKNQIKTLFVKNNEMARGKSAWAIREQIATYLNYQGVNRAGVLGRYTLAKKNKPEGFTSESYDNVTVKVKSSHNLAKIDIKQMLKELDDIIQQGAKGTGKHKFPDGDHRWFGFLEAGGGFDSNASRFLTWLHEVGHQVHYKAGRIAKPTDKYLTKYANAKRRDGSFSDEEWFAEHFVAYILRREELNKVWPDIVSWFDNILG